MKIIITTISDSWGSIYGMSMRFFSVWKHICYCQNGLTGAMGFFIRIKLNNIFRSILITDEEEQNKPKLIENIIFKGKFEFELSFWTRLSKV